jgi:hypothetical protein
LPALVERRLLVRHGVVLQVGRELPFVVCVGFGEVDEGEIGPIPEVLGERFDVARPTTKRRSGEAAEDEQQRPTLNELREPDGLQIHGAPHCHLGQRVAGL